MSKVLVMNFLTAEGKKASLRFKDVKEGIEPSVVGTAMDTIIEKNVFATTYGDLTIKDSAEIIDTTVEELSI